MTVETERRFLLADDSWCEAVDEPLVLQQGYLSVEKECTICVRIIGSQAWLTLRDYIFDMAHSEPEYKIPLAHAQAMTADMCLFRMEKYRYRVGFEGFVYEIDEYFGDNAPSIVAEIELSSEDTEFPKPSWLGKEITSDGKFTNACLSKHPYSSWTE